MYYVVLLTTKGRKMQKHDIEKLEKIAKKCSNVHNNTESDVDIVRAVQKGYQIAYDIMVWANKNKDKALFEAAYKLSKNILPESSKLDSVILSQLKEQKSKFLEKVVTLLIDRPETILNPTKQQIKKTLNKTTDENEQKKLNKRLDSIDESIGAIQYNRGIMCEESAALFRKANAAKVSTEQKYIEEFVQYQK